jgi:RHS repeat-associated protein
VTRSSSGSVTYQVATSQGTATTAVDASTFAVTRRFYDPYGNARGTSPSSWVSADENHGYLGKPADSVTGLDLLGARNYDPTLGRFLTPDPVFESGDPNQMGGYSYAGDNPATQSDPSGLCPKDICDGYGQHTGETSTSSGGGSTSTSTSSGGTGSGTGGGSPTPSPSPGAPPTPGPYPPAPHNFVTDIVVSIAKTAFDLVNCEFWLSGGGPDHDASCETAGGVVSGGGLEGGGLGAAERGVVGDAEGTAEGVATGDAAAAAGAGAKAVDEAASDAADLAALKRANAQARAEEAEAAASGASKLETGAAGTAKAESKQVSTFFNPEDRLNDLVPRTRRAPGYHDVWIHGSPNSVSPSMADAESGGASVVNHRVLAQMLEQDPNYTGGPIRLCSCQTGAPTGSFAQDLANKMGVEVMAPNGYLWVFDNGRMSVGRPGALLRRKVYFGGRWLTFQPGGSGASGG